MDIPFEIVPGVSSSYSVPAYAGIPVTHRGMASSFHVITGHEDGNKTSSALDYQTLAKEEGTLVFLMGLKNLDKIAAQPDRKWKRSEDSGSGAGAGNHSGPEKCEGQIWSTSRKRQRKPD